MPDAKFSAILLAFLDYLDGSRSIYDAAYEAVGSANRQSQDILHGLEFAQSADEILEVARKGQESRRERRTQKDIVEEYEPVIRFLDDSKHTRTINDLRRLLDEVRRVEEYHSRERVYKPRCKDGSDYPEGQGGAHDVEMQSV